MSGSRRIPSKPEAARPAPPMRPAAAPPLAATAGPTMQQPFSYASLPTHSPASSQSSRLRRSAAKPGPAEAPPIVHEVLRGAGEALDDTTRAGMERRLGYDLGGVRIHTDDRAAASARSVNALAYTVGSSIVFDHGRYAPQQPDGQRLLTHELVHTIQQRGAPPAGGQPLHFNAAGSSEEIQAVEIAALATDPHPNVVARGDLGEGRAAAGVAPVGTLQRQPVPDPHTRIGQRLLAHVVQQDGLPMERKPPEIARDHGAEAAASRAAAAAWLPAAPLSPATGRPVGRPDGGEPHPNALAGLSARRHPLEVGVLAGPRPAIQRQQPNGQPNSPRVATMHAEAAQARSRAAEMIKRHTNMFGLNLDEEGLAKELVAGLPGDVDVVLEVFGLLDVNDIDDVAQAMSEAMGTRALLEQKLRPHPALARMLVVFLQLDWTTDAEADAIERMARAGSPDHDRLAREPWNSSPTITKALAATGAELQPNRKGWGDLILDEYSVVVDRMPPGLTPEAYLQEMADHINAAVKSRLFDTIDTFARRPKPGNKGGPAVGDIYHINIYGPDNGSVMLVESTPDHFIFQTVWTNEDGYHPEYGARQFGFERLRGGAVRWYTKGVSRPGRAPGAGPVGRPIQELGFIGLLNGIGAELARRGGVTRSGSFDSWNTHRDATGGSGRYGL